MTTRLPEPFVPVAVLEGGRSLVTGVTFTARRSTTEEQREQAIRHAADFMAEARIFTVEVEVRWTRGEPTVLTVRAHPEHVGERVVPVVDRVTEADLEGRAISQTPAERHMTLERELDELNAEGLG